MKKLINICVSGLMLFSVISCQDLENLNNDPNNPAEVPTNMIMAGTQKRIMDDIYDNWFSARQCLVYSQYWSQRVYTEEDRYQIRESVNNNYFIYLYQGISSLNEIIKFNMDEETRVEMAIYGDNNNQIAAARILKAWLFQLMADTWGSIPYYDVAQLKEDVYYPKYDDQQEIYRELIKELTEAAAMINEDEPAFNGGDRIYDGDASKWKKFANSLKCRLAIHMSKVDSNWKNYIAEAIADGVFESNADNAGYKYSNTAPEQCGFYKGINVDSRNDFTISAPFVDILKGQRDTLNNKQHPWEGVRDPRLEIYTTARNGEYIGLPYGASTSEQTNAMRNAAPDFDRNPPLVVRADFTVPLMTYAELQFILSEYNTFSVAEYQEGVRASIAYWNDLNGTSISAEELDAYIEAVSQNVDAEAVALQKYIDLYMNGTEAWVEYRRTGYPVQLIKPNEVTYEYADGSQVIFTTLSDTKGDIVSRVKYPTNESTLNGENFNAAVAKLTDGTNNYYTKMFWDARTAGDPHPANK